MEFLMKDVIKKYNGFIVEYEGERYGLIYGNIYQSENDPMKILVVQEPKPMKFSSEFIANMNNIVQYLEKKENVDMSYARWDELTVALMARKELCKIIGEYEKN